MLDFTIIYFVWLAFISGIQWVYLQPAKNPVFFFLNTKDKWCDVTLCRFCSRKKTSRLSHISHLKILAWKPQVYCVSRSWKDNRGQSVLFKARRLLRQPPTFKTSWSLSGGAFSELFTPFSEHVSPAHMDSSSVFGFYVQMSCLTLCTWGTLVCVSLRSLVSLRLFPPTSASLVGETHLKYVVNKQHYILHAALYFTAALIILWYTPGTRPHYCIPVSLKSWPGHQSHLVLMIFWHSSVLAAT